MCVYTHVCFYIHACTVYMRISFPYACGSQRTSVCPALSLPIFFPWDRPQWTWGQDESQRPQDSLASDLLPTPTLRLQAHGILRELGIRTRILFLNGKYSWPLNCFLSPSNLFLFISNREHMTCSECALFLFRQLPRSFLVKLITRRAFGTLLFCRVTRSYHETLCPSFW